MPIPDFVDEYHLPGHEHECTLEEIEARFVSTPERKTVWDLFKGLLFRLESLGLEPDKILIDGSFVTGREKPGDVDWCALIDPQKMKIALNAANEEDVAAIKYLFGTSSGENQSWIRVLFGSHLMVAPNEEGFAKFSRIFRRGIHGSLKDPDPTKDPEWVTRPREKGILKVINPCGEGRRSNE